MERATGIKKYCKIMISTYPTRPRAQYLTDGHWLVIAEKPLAFSISCKSKSTSELRTTKCPLDIIRLNSTCSAYNAYMTLLPYYHKESKFNVTDVFRQFLRRYSFGIMTLWKTFDTTIPNFNDSKIPPKLKEIKEIPINKLKEEIDNMNLNEEPMPASPRYWICIIGTVTIILIIIIFVKFRRRLLNYIRLRLRSVKKGNEEVSQQLSRPQPSAPRLQDGEESSVTFSSSPGHSGTTTRYGNGTKYWSRLQDGNGTTTYRPYVNLSRRYLQEKYGLVPMENMTILNNLNDMVTSTQSSCTRQSPDEKQRPISDPSSYKEYGQGNDPMNPGDKKYGQDDTSITSPIPVPEDNPMVTADIAERDDYTETEVQTVSPSKGSNSGHSVKRVTNYPIRKPQAKPQQSIYPSLREELKTTQ